MNDQEKKQLENQRKYDLIYYYGLYIDFSQPGVAPLSDMPELRLKIIQIASRLFYEHGILASEYLENYANGKETEILQTIKKYESMSEG